MKNEEGLVKFLMEQQTRLSCIIRYNNTPKVVGESVAEHSYYVSLMAMLIADYLNAQHTNLVKTDELIRMALLHDVEEIISGDIIKVLKTAGFREELERMNRQSMEYLVGKLPFGIWAEYLDLWQKCKDRTTIEAQLLDFVDWLAVVTYSIKEVHLGNRYFEEILVYALRSFKKFSDAIPQLEPLLNEITEYATKYLEKDQALVDAINSAVRMKSVTEKFEKEEDIG